MKFFEMREWKFSKWDQFQFFPFLYFLSPEMIFSHFSIKSSKSSLNSNAGAWSLIGFAVCGYHSDHPPVWKLIKILLFYAKILSLLRQILKNRLEEIDNIESKLEAEKFTDENIHYKVMIQEMVNVDGQIALKCIRHLEKLEKE